MTRTKSTRTKPGEPRPITRMVRCPNCRQSVRYDAKNAFRPFCSERCKTFDAASWAEESYRVPGEEASPEDLIAAMRGDSETDD